MGAHSVQVGIVGGSGYAGGEPLRLLVQHPRDEAELAHLLVAEMTASGRRASLDDVGNAIGAIGSGRVKCTWRSTWIPCRETCQCALRKGGFTAEERRRRRFFGGACRCSARIHRIERLDGFGDRLHR